MAFKKKIYDRLNFVLRRRRGARTNTLSVKVIFGYATARDVVDVIGGGSDGAVAR